MKSDLECTNVLLMGSLRRVSFGDGFCVPAVPLPPPALFSPQLFFPAVKIRWLGFSYSAFTAIVQGRGETQTTKTHTGEKWRSSCWTRLPRLLALYRNRRPPELPQLYRPRPRRAICVAKCKAKCTTRARAESATLSRIRCARRAMPASSTASGAIT